MAREDCIVIPGGAVAGREFDAGMPLEAAFEAALGDRIRSDDDFAGAVWCALANVAWTSPNGKAWGYTFRAAGDLVAAIRGDRGHMPYMRWYCWGEDGVVSAAIAEAMAALGWSFAIDR